MKLRAHRLAIAAAGLLAAWSSAASADDISLAAVDHEVLATLGGTPLAGTALASVTGLGGGTGVSVENAAIAVSVNVMEQRAVQISRFSGFGAMETGDVSLGDGNVIVGSAININTGLNAVQGAQRSSAFAVGDLE